jgi:simple sugar transport system ATP-binding protein
MIELRGISKIYPGSIKPANNNISIDLYKGEILCIAGENGAGKSTLMKILYGLETPDTGDIYVNGKMEKIDSPLVAKKHGIGMVHQHFKLFDDFTVAENIVMGNEPRKLKVLFDKNKARETALEIISKHNFNLDSKSKVKDLSQGEKQEVEICRILQWNAQILILDEPTSILTEYETASLFKTLRQLVSDGKSIILITHKLHEIKQICNRAVVLRQGKVTGIFNTPDINEENILRAMMGGNTCHRAAQNTEKSQHIILLNNPDRKNEKKIISFENVTVRRRGQKKPLLEDISFEVNSGEILGFTGVGGNGLGVIEAVLGGFLHPSEGRVKHRDNDISNYSIRALRNQGLAFVPSDRIRTGSAKDGSINENMIISRRHDFMKGLIINKKSVKEYSDKLVKNYNIEGANGGQAGGNELCAFLSGGNLQKLILAREIDSLKDYIVFSEPTWGLDIISGNFIINEISTLRTRGAAIILISTNLDEILRLSDRIMVMYRGRIAGVFVNNKDDLIKEAIGRCASGN